MSFFRASLLVVFIVIALFLADAVSAWTTLVIGRTRYAQRTTLPPVIGRTAQGQMLTLLAASKSERDDASHFYEEEDCFDLCETDDEWDLVMPTSDGEDMKKPTVSNRMDEKDTTEKEVNESMATASRARVDESSSSSTTTPSQQKQQDKQHKRPSFQRMRLEMQWELRNNAEDCDLEEIDTCGDFCVDCVGVGRVQCRFCQGAGKLHLPETNLYGGERIQPCPVCNQSGTEECKACRGSGRIAPWTSYSTT